VTWKTSSWRELSIIDPITGRPYLSTYTQKAPFTRKIVSKNADGDECVTVVTEQPEAVETRDFELKNWSKTLLFQNLTQKWVWIPVENSPSFQRIQGLVIENYAVESDACKCQSCAEHGESFDFIRLMPDSGIFQRCFRTDCTRSMFLGKLAIKYGIYRLLSERFVDKAEATELLQSGEAFCGNVMLRMELLGKV
jgi:hypothetical protein